jgi:hypothetical protein
MLFAKMMDARVKPGHDELVAWMEPTDRANARSMAQSGFLFARPRIAPSGVAARRPVGFIRATDSIFKQQTQLHDLAAGLLRKTTMSRCALSLEGFAPRCVRLSNIEIRMTGSMSPRAKATLAAMRMAFGVANIARSFDIGHLACFFRPRCSKATLAHLHRWSALVLT